MKKDSVKYLFFFYLKMNYINEKIKSLLLENSILFKLLLAFAAGNLLADIVSIYFVTYLLLFNIYAFRIK